MSNTGSWAGTSGLRVSRGNPSSRCSARACTTYFQRRGIPACPQSSMIRFELGSSSILTHSLNTLLPLRGEDGEELLHNIVVRPISSRRFDHCLLQINDVTVAVTRERVLRDRQNARYHAIVDTAPDAIITTGLDRTIQWVNGAAEHVFGYVPSELMGRKIDFLVEDNDALSRAFIAEGESGKGADSSFQVIGRRKQGPPACFEVSFGPLEGGRPRFHNDDLARRDRKDGRRGRASRQRKPSSRAAGGLAATGVDLRPRTAIATISIRNGRPTPALRRSSTLDRAGSRRFTNPNARICWLRGSHRCANGVVFDVDARLRRADGTHRWFKMRSIPVRAPDGQITRWFGTATDITDHIEARDALRRSNEELEALVVERTREREVALRQLHESQKMETHRSADGRGGTRFQQSCWPSSCRA